MPETFRPVLFCGENPAMTLYQPGDTHAVLVASYWHCTYSPLGVGQALILWHAGQAPPASAIYSDNQPLARMLVEELAQHFPEFHDLPIAGLPHHTAQLRRKADHRHYRVTCATPAGELELVWGDQLDHKLLVWPQFPAGPRSFDLSTVICPCGYAAAQLESEPIAAAPRVGEQNSTPTSSAFLAFCETWIGAL